MVILEPIIVVQVRKIADVRRVWYVITRHEMDNSDPHVLYTLLFAIPTTEV